MIIRVPGLLLGLKKGLVAQWAAHGAVEISADAEVPPGSTEPKSSGHKLAFWSIQKPQDKLFCVAIAHVAPQLLEFMYSLTKGCVKS